MWTTSKDQNLILLGRVLLSVIFIMSGLTKIFDWNSTLQYMSGVGIPFAPLFLLPAILIEVVGGGSLLLGLKARWGALALLVYLVPVTLIFHGFWMFEGAERQIQLINFFKNLAIMGGLAGFAVHGAGARSIDARINRPKPGQGFQGRDRIRAVS